MKHWGKPLPLGIKFPQGVGKTVFPQEQKELDRQAERKQQEHFGLSLPKMPKVNKP